MREASTLPARITAQCRLRDVGRHRFDVQSPKQGYLTAHVLRTSAFDTHIIGALGVLDRHRALSIAWALSAQRVQGCWGLDMKAGFALSIGFLAVGSGCSTVHLARLDHCTVQRTHSWSGSDREELVFCDRDAPKWSDDRTLRLTQECLYEADLNRRDAMILSARSGHPAPTTVGSEDVFAHCYPDAVKSVQNENEALKERLAREKEEHAQLDGLHEKFDARLNDEHLKQQAQLDSQREKLDSQREKLESQMDSQREKLEDRHGKLEAQLVGQHTKIEDQLLGQHGKLDEALASQNGKLEESLTKSLQRPINAVAEARSTSDSGSQTRHNSDSKELARFDYGGAMPPVQNVQATVPPAVAKPARKSSPKPATVKPLATCGMTCGAAPSEKGHAQATPSSN
jgi:hypothetical protein